MKMLILSLLASLILAGCGSTDVAGNSSETGNCRVVGVVNIAGDTPADSVPVVLAPSGYTLSQNKDLLDTVWTNEEGYYHFDTVQPGSWTLSIRNEEKTLAMISQGIELSLGDSADIDGELLEVGGISIERVDSSEAVTVSIEGTPWGGTLGQGEVSLVLPAVSTNESLSVIVENENDSIIYKDTVEVLIGDTTTVISAKRALVIHGATEETLLALYGDQIRDAGLVPIAVAADTIDVNDFDGVDLFFITGTPALDQGIKDMLDVTEKPVVCGTSYLYPALRMSGTEEGIDFGIQPTAAFNVGSNSDHPIYNGLPYGPGLNVGILFDDSMNWGKPSGDYFLLGVLPINPNYYGLFAYETGKALSSGTAPGRRVGVFANGSQLTEAGKTILTNSIVWAAEL